MALTSPHMGLRIWNLITDLFDHDQLADNLAKLDIHDHTLGRGVQIPTDGLADGAVTSAKLATILDPGPAYTSYKYLSQFNGQFAPTQTLGSSYMMPHTAGTVSLPGGSSTAQGYPLYIEPADYNVPGRTTYFRIRGLAIANAVASGSTFTLALNPVATWGGTSGNQATVATIGGQVAGSTAAIVAPAASGPAPSVTSADFALTAGWYVMTVTIGVQTPALNSNVTITGRLQYRQV